MIKGSFSEDIDDMMKGKLMTKHVDATAQNFLDKLPISLLALPHVKAFCAAPSTGFFHRHMSCCSSQKESCVNELLRLFAVKLMRLDETLLMSRQATSEIASAALLTDPHIPFRRVGDDVDIEIVPGQVAS